MQKMIFSLLLVLSLPAHAEDKDTYNFYFQKAPGPVTVNQGGQAAPVNPGSAPPTPVATPAAVSSSSVAAEEPESRPAFRPWKLSLGFAGNSSTDPSYGSRYSDLITGQWTAGLQYNFAQWIGLQAEVYYLKGQFVDGYQAPSGEIIPVSSVSSGGSARTETAERELGGSRLDYGASLVFTPFRLRPSSWLGLNFSALLGSMTVPTYGVDENWRSKIDHRNAFYGGLRVGAEMASRVAVHASLKRLQKYEDPIGSVEVAVLF